MTTATITPTTTTTTYVVEDAHGREVYRTTKRFNANRKAANIEGARVVTAAEAERPWGRLGTPPPVVRVRPADFDEMTGTDYPDVRTRWEQLVDHLADADAEYFEGQTIYVVRAIRGADFDEMTGTDWPDVKAAKAAGGRKVCKSGAPRLRRGALGTMVEDFIHGRPGEEFSPHQVGKALDRSVGAVRNALDRLVAQNVARVVAGPTRRYTVVV